MRIILAVNICGIGVGQSVNTIACLSHICYRAGADGRIVPYAVEHMILQFNRNSVQSSFRIIRRMNPGFRLLAAQFQPGRNVIIYRICIGLVVIQFICVKALAAVDAYIGGAGIPVAIAILGIVSFIILNICVAMSRRLVSLCLCGRLGIAALCRALFGRFLN